MTDEAKFNDLVVEPNPRFVFRQEDDGALLFDPDTDSLRLLNETGAYIFENADGSRTVGQLIDALAEEFGEAREKVAREAGEFIEELLGKELLLKKE
jgi:hypothetical protein